jgi:hypothetical protein
MRFCTTLSPRPAHPSRPWLGGVLILLMGTGLAGAALAAETPSLVVTTTADGRDPNDNLTSFREAMVYARQLGGAQTVTFDPSVAGQTFYLKFIEGHAWGDTALYTTTPVTVDGGSAGVTIARDPSVPNLRLLEVFSSTCTLKSVTIKGGRAKAFGAHEGGGAAGLGGAMIVTGNLVLQGVSFVDNQALGGSFEGTGVGGGAGVYTPGSTYSQAGTAPDGPDRYGGYYGTGPAGVGGRGSFGSGGGLGDLQGGAGGFGGGGGGSGTSDAQGGAGGFGGGRGTFIYGGGGAGMGGAIFNAGGTVTGSNVTFSGNAAIGGLANPAAPVTAANNGSGLGGAIFNFNGVVKLTHVTMANNIAAQGGGAIYHVGDNGAPMGVFNLASNSATRPASVVLTNCLLSGSNDGAATPARVSDFVQKTNDTNNSGLPNFLNSSGEGNLFQTRATAADDFGGTALTADPLLLPLENNGGSTPTFALSLGSPARNAGVGTSVFTDQRGRPRVVNPVGVPGLIGSYYGSVTTSQSLLAPISNLEGRTPTATQITPNVDFGSGTETAAGDGSVLDRQGSNDNPFGWLGVNLSVDNNNMAALWVGVIAVPETATYRFTTRSDDGSVLFIDGQLIVDNNFPQPMTNRSGDIALTAGRHTIKIGYYESQSQAGMQASWEQLDGVAPFPRQIIPPSVLTQAILSASPDIGAFEHTDSVPPAGGTFTVLPGTSAVKAGAPLATVFAGWTDESSFQYEVSDGATVLFPLSNDTTHFFTLPVGMHHLSARLVDLYGFETDLGPFDLLVDGQAPHLTVPEDISLVADTEDDAVIHFDVTATDDNDLHPVVTVSTPSGSAFPNGTTTVTVTATDAAGNVALANFHVTVVHDFVAYRKPFALDGLVPGAGEPDSDIEEEMLFNSFGSPAINSAGDVVLLAKKHIGKVKYHDITFHRGARDAASGLPTGKRLARVGDAVPGISDVVWASLKDPQIAEDGSVLVLGTVKGAISATVVPPAEKTVVVWYPVANGAKPQLVARTGQTLATADGAKLKSILGTALVSHGVVAIMGGLTPGSGIPAVSGATDRVALTWDADSGELVTRVREGSSPGGGLPIVKTFKTLAAGSGAPGMGRGWLVSEEASPSVLVANPVTSALAHLRVQATFTDGVVGDLSIDLASGIWKVLFATGSDGTEISGVADARLKSLGLMAAGGNNNIAITRAAPSNGAIGLFARNGEQAASLVRVGDTAPQAGGALYKSFADPIVSADGAGYAFLAKLTGAGTTVQNDSAIYWGDAGGFPNVLVAREGAAAPGTEGGVFKAFSSLAAPGGGQGPILLAKLAIGPGGVTSANDVGLWAMDAQGNLRLLLREGTTNIGSKTVKSFKTLAVSAGSPGTTHNFNGAGEITAVVTFTDTTSAVVTMTLPPSAVLPQ